MAGRIPQEFIDELIRRVDIVELIDSRVPLKKAGREYTARCPFHDERTPSFTVSPTKQFYHCFGCGAHGTALGFLMDYERMEFRDAVQELADAVGMEIPKDAQAGHEGPGTGPLYEVLDEAAAFYRRQLREAPKAVEYLKGRGLTGEIAREYGLGYAPPGWESLKSRFPKERHEDLLRAGLIIRREERGGGGYDRFRDRVMFPIRDGRGRIVGFGGRVMGEGTPKYLNSPETPVFHKGRELYGLYEARRALREIPRLLVVEGYMDVLALAQQGIRYAVATLGTATTADHLERLFRVTPEVVFCFDGDRAGREAAWRALENALGAMRGDRQGRFLFLPEGHDPDSLVREEGAEAFESRVAEATPLAEYFIRRLSEQADPATVDGRARLVELARPYLSRIPEGGFRLVLSERLGEISRVDPGKLATLIETGSRNAKPRVGATRPSRQRPRMRRVTPVRWALGLLLEDPRLGLRVHEELNRLRSIDLQGIDLLVRGIELVHRDPHLTTAGLLEHFRDHEYAPYLAELARGIWGEGAENREREFDEAIRHLLSRGLASALDERLDQLRRKEQEGLISRDEKQELLRLINEITEHRAPGA